MRIKRTRTAIRRDGRKPMSRLKVKMTGDNSEVSGELWPFDLDRKKEREGSARVSDLGLVLHGAIERDVIPRVCMSGELRAGCPVGLNEAGLGLVVVRGTFQDDAGGERLGSLVLVF
jgi:hypothetical protein